MLPESFLNHQQMQTNILYSYFKTIAFYTASLNMNAVAYYIHTFHKNENENGHLKK